jgi:hypothetical protein
MLVWQALNQGNARAIENTNITAAYKKLILYREVTSG